MSDVPWVVIQSIYFGPDDNAPALDVFGPFDSADDAFAWVERQGKEDGVGYRVEPIGMPPA